MKLYHKIGEGLERTVWLHPKHRDRVVKISKPSAVFNRNQSDWEWFQELQHVVTDHIPVLYGFEKTSYGEGLVSELIHDEDGMPSSCIRTCLRRGDLSVDKAFAMLAHLYEWVISSGIPISDSNLGNVLYQRTSNKKRLVIVDGFGSSNGFYWWVVKRFRPLIYYNNIRKKRRSLRYLSDVVRTLA